MNNGNAPIVGTSKQMDAFRERKAMGHNNNLLSMFERISSSSSKTETGTKQTQKQK